MSRDNRPKKKTPHCGSIPQWGSRSTAAEIYEVRPRKDHRGVDLISDVLPFGGLCFTGSRENRR